MAKEEYLGALSVLVNIYLESNKQALLIVDDFFAELSRCVSEYLHDSLSKNLPSHADSKFLFHYSKVFKSIVRR